MIFIPASHQVDLDSTQAGMVFIVGSISTRVEWPLPCAAAADGQRRRRRRAHGASNPRSHDAREQNYLKDRKQTT